jgi:hypothetical protein
MNAKTIYVLFLSCLLLIIFSIGGVLVGWLGRDPISWLIEQRDKEQRNKKVMLVVAKHDYPKGTIITDPEEMFELREFLDRDAPIHPFLEGFSEVAEAWRGAILTNDIREGQPLQRHISLEPLTFAALIKVGKLEPARPGRVYIPITTAQAREDSLRVGTRVDVIESKSKEDPKDELKILLHDVLLRAVLPASFLQGRLEKDGKTNLVALRVLVETSTEEGQAFFASLKQYDISDFFEVRPRVDNRKVDNKNSPKAH